MGDYNDLLREIREMLKMISDGQDRIIQDINDLKEEQKKLKEEIRISNFVLNNMGIRNEILN